MQGIFNLLTESPGPKSMQLAFKTYAFQTTWSEIFPKKLKKKKKTSSGFRMLFQLPAVTFVWMVGNLTADIYI